MFFYNTLLQRREGTLSESTFSGSTLSGHTLSPQGLLMLNPPQGLLMLHTRQRRY